MADSRILEAIEDQRRYFFKNYPKVLMDKLTGYLWPDLDYFELRQYANKAKGEMYLQELARESGFNGWQVPTNSVIASMIEDYTFPFQGGSNWRIMNEYTILTSSGCIDLDNLHTGTRLFGYILPFTSCLVDDNHSYNGNTEDTLKLFTKYNLWPEFYDEAITELYGETYIKKSQPAVQTNSHKAVPPEPVKFDYTQLLSRYDLNAVSSSVIKYFQALQSWTDELMTLLDSYEAQKAETIREFNTITLRLSRKYDDSPDLSPSENELLRERQESFRHMLSLGMNDVKAKLLSLRTQADELASRIYEADSITELAAIEGEKRASFPLIAERTAGIIMNALTKIEFFEAHREFVVNAVRVLTEWTEDYRVFMTSRRADFLRVCSDDGIDEDVRAKWFEDWQRLRLEVERKLQPVIERGLRGEMPGGDGNVPAEIIGVLEKYKGAVDKFFLEERRGIYQGYAFKPGGELLDRLEAESELYKRTSQFQSDLQRIIFACERPEDRIFILKWADSLLDIRIDEVLELAADDDMQRISDDVLSEFSQLKQKNYEAYLTDAHAYSDEKARREKEYNRLIFKMRKDLVNQ